MNPLRSLLEFQSLIKEYNEHAAQSKIVLPEEEHIGEILEIPMERRYGTSIKYLVQSTTCH